MPIKRYEAEQIVTLLRQIEVWIANGKLTQQACKEAEITVHTFYRWRKEYGGLKLDQAKRLEELERENTNLRRVVAELTLEEQVFRDTDQSELAPSFRGSAGRFLPTLRMILRRLGDGTRKQFHE